jgi:hypothetical protein
MSDKNLVLKTSLSVNSQTFEQIQFVSKDAVVSLVMGKALIYLPKHDSNFLVDKINKKLVKIDISTQVAQVSQTRPLLGAFSFDTSQRSKEIAGLVSRHIIINSNINSPIKIKADIYYTAHSKLAETSWPAFVAYEQRTRFFSIDLKPDDLITRIHIETGVNGTVQIQTVELVSLENVSTPHEVKEYLEYSKN